MRGYIQSRNVFLEINRERVDLYYGSTAESGKSYEIINVKVKVYGRQKYLSTTDETEVKEIDDIGGVCEYVYGCTKMSRRN